LKAKKDAEASEEEEKKKSMKKELKLSWACEVCTFLNTD
jgi:hypothetical protein